MNGIAYWRSVLGPYAALGFHRGVLDPLEVVLFGDDGEEVHLPRPRNGWVPVGGIDLSTELEEHESAEPPVRLWLSATTASRLLGGES